MQPTHANQQKRGQFKKFAVKVIEWIRKSLALGKNEVFTNTFSYYFSVAKSTLLSRIVCFFLCLSSLGLYTF